MVLFKIIKGDSPDTMKATFHVIYEDFINLDKDYTSVFIQ